MPKHPSLARQGGLALAQREAMALLLSEGHSVLLVGEYKPNYIKDQLNDLGVSVDFTPIDLNKYVFEKKQ